MFRLGIHRCGVLLTVKQITNMTYFSNHRKEIQDSNVSMVLKVRAIRNPFSFCCGLFHR
jgi:hypothetical protein